MTDCRIMCGEFEIGYAYFRDIIDNDAKIYDNVIYAPTEFNKDNDWYGFMNWIQTRVCPKGRNDIKAVLQRLGLDRYDPLAMCKITRAGLPTDHFWIKLYDSDSYEDYDLAYYFSKGIRIMYKDIFSV